MKDTIENLSTRHKKYLREWLEAAIAKVFAEKRPHDERMSWTLEDMRKYWK